MSYSFDRAGQVLEALRDRRRTETFRRDHLTSTLAIFEHPAAVKPHEWQAAVTYVCRRGGADRVRELRAEAAGSVEALELAILMVEGLG